MSVTPRSFDTAFHKLNVNLAIVASEGPFTLYPSVKESLFSKMNIDASFNATIEMDVDGHTWLLLNLGNTCGELLSGDVRHQNKRLILARLVDHL